MRLRDYDDIGKVHSGDLAKALDNLRATQTHDVALGKRLISASGESICSDELDTECEGRFSLLHRGIRFECFAKPQSGADKLYVFFTGRHPVGYTDPIFLRWSYYTILDGHTLSIDDPMPTLYDEIRLGWYFGTKDENYCEYVAEIVVAYATKLGVKTENIVFVGSSGGGFASLYCACIVEGTTAIAINSQIRLSLHGSSNTFRKVIGVDLSLEEPHRRTRLDELIADSTKSRFIVATNIRSEIDMRHLSFLEKALGCEGGSGYGVTRLANHVLSWCYDAPSKKPHGVHSAQEWKTMFYALDLLAQHFADAEKLREHYLVFSELWHERYVQNEKFDELTEKLKTPPSFVALPESLESAITIPVFDGDLAGGISESNNYNYFHIPVDFEQGTYSVSVTALPGGEQSFGVLVMNMVTKAKPYRYDKADGSHVFVFNVDSPSQAHQVLLYPYAIGKTKGKSLEVKVSVRCAD